MWLCRSLRSVDKFISFIGLDQKPVDPGADDVCGINRSQVSIITSSQYLSHATDRSYHCSYLTIAVTGNTHWPVYVACLIFHVPLSIVPYVYNWFLLSSLGTYCSISYSFWYLLTESVSSRYEVFQESVIIKSRCMLIVKIKWKKYCRWFVLLLCETYCACVSVCMCRYCSVSTLFMLFWGEVLFLTVLMYVVWVIGCAHMLRFITWHTIL